MKDYYNEYDKKTAAWLRELIKQGHLPEGDVDERSIEDVVPRDLIGYRRHHFFAGIGGWAYALELAGWPDDLPVWTGSCPCQPFSAAGQSAGFNDERHLWPAWQHLIAQCRPARVYFEQVASKAVSHWIDLVFDDMEAMGYACAAAAFPASSVGAPHARHRTYGIASDARSIGRSGFSPAGSTGEMRQGWEVGEVDLRQIIDSPFAPGRRHPQPLLRGMDDGLSTRVVRVRGYGNAIVPQQAAEFLISVMQVIDDEVR